MRFCTIPRAVLAPALLLFLSACDLVIASNSAPPEASPQSGTTPIPPSLAPPSTADLQPTVDAAVQKQLAAILTPAPGSGDGPAAQPERKPTAITKPPDTPRPTPGPGQAPTPPPGAEFQPQYYRSGFACTGSMRPTIDCGDEGVFLKPPFPEPLVVGDVISFSPEESCRHYRNHDISKAHRIISIRAESGTDYYTTQGDSALTPDDCEVTIDQIDGKLVEVNKGSRPQDVIDTAEYDAAKEKVRRLKEQYQNQRAAYDQRKAEYDSRGEEYEQLVNRYRERRASYQEVTQFQEELEEERVALNRLREELNSLGEEINATIDEVDRLYRELFVR